MNLFTSTYVYNPSANSINLALSDMLYHANKEATDERRPLSALQYHFESTGYTCPAMAMNYTAFEDGSSMIGSQHFPA